MFDHDGNQIWNFSAPSYGYATPAVVNQTIVHTDKLNLYARSISDGSLIWNYSENHKIFEDASVTIHEGKVWVPSGSSLWNVTPSAYTFNLTTGSLMNKYDFPMINTSVGMQYAESVQPCTISEDVVYWFGTAQSYNGYMIIAMNESNGGQQIWNYTSSGKGGIDGTSGLYSSSSLRITSMALLS